MSEESIKPPSKTDISFYKYGQGRVKFTGICLNKVVYLLLMET